MSVSAKRTAQMRTGRSTRRVDSSCNEESLGGQSGKNGGDDGGKNGRGTCCKDGSGEGGNESGGTDGKDVGVEGGNEYGDKGWEDCDGRGGTGGEEGNKVEKATSLCWTRK